MSSFCDPDIMDRMMSADPDEEFRQICMCIRKGDVAKARTLYRGANMNQPLSIWDRRPPLHLAIGKPDIAMVRFLLEECDADPNAIDDKGRTALHMAVLEGNDDIIQLLIDHGRIDFKAVDKWGQTALHLASLCSNISAARLLLEHCMECLQIRQKDGITPLQIATMADNKQIAALFLAALDSSNSANVLSDLDQANMSDLPTPPSLHCPFFAADSETQRAEEEPGAESTVIADKQDEEIDEVESAPIPQQEVVERPVEDENALSNDDKEDVGERAEHPNDEEMIEDNDSNAGNEPEDAKSDEIETKIAEEVSHTAINEGENETNNAAENAIDNEEVDDDKAPISPSSSFKEVEDAKEPISPSSSFKEVEDDKEPISPSSSFKDQSPSPSQDDFDIGKRTAKSDQLKGHLSDLASKFTFFMSEHDRLALDNTRLVAMLNRACRERQSFKDQLLQEHKHFQQLSERFTRLIDAYEHEFETMHAESANLRLLLANALAELSQFTDHVRFIEELLPIFESQRAEINYLRTEFGRVCSLDSEMQDVQAENSALKSTISSLRDELIKSQDENVALREQLQQAESERTRLLELCEMHKDLHISIKRSNTEPESHSDHGNERDTDQKSSEIGRKSQFSFQPGATSDAQGPWIMSWNLFGCIVSRVIDKVDRRIQIQFADSDDGSRVCLTDRNGYNKASLGKFSALFSSPRKSESVPATVFYKTFETLPDNTDWSAKLPEGEDVVAITLVGRHAAVCSDNGILRLISQSGVHRAVFCLDNAAVCMAGSTYNHLAVITTTPSCSYCYSLYEVDEQIRRLGSGVCPVSANCTIAWAGFSEEGQLIVMDSLSVLRGLVSVSGASYEWVPLLDGAKHCSEPGSKIWPVAATCTDLLVATLPNGIAEPSPTKRPILESLPFSIPTLLHDQQSGSLEQRCLINTMLAGNYQSIASVGSNIQRNEAKVSCAHVLVKQDVTLIELFQAALNNKNTSRAIELATRLSSEKSFDSARKIAEKMNQTVVVGRLDQISRARFPKQTQTDLSQTAQLSLPSNNRERASAATSSALAKTAPAKLKVSPALQTRSSAPISDSTANDAPAVDSDLKAEDPSHAPAGGLSQFDQLRMRYS